MIEVQLQNMLFNLVIVLPIIVGGIVFSLMLFSYRD